MPSSRVVITQNDLRTLPGVTRRAAGRVVRGVLESIAERAAEHILSDPKTGIVYGDHQASAPGEAPASDTGRLVGSIHVEIDGELTGVVVVDAPYAEALELGSRHIAPRPFLAPSAQEAEPDFIRLLREAIQQAVRRGR